MNDFIQDDVIFLSECYIFYTCLDLTLYKYIFFLALAHAIDLMLPARLSDMKVMRRRHKSNTDAHSAEMDHNIKSGVWSVRVMVFNTTFNNISVTCTCTNGISWPSVLLVEETGLHR
jgi:hypothetical protein